MFAVDDIVVADDVAEAPFACALARCKGACCVEGDAGAPLLRSETGPLDRVLERILPMLRPAARTLVSSEGAWSDSGDNPEVRCTDDGACVFVRYGERGTAQCVLQSAYREGLIEEDVKPSSCYLFPLRVEERAGYRTLRYRRLSRCAPGRERGRAEQTHLVDFLRRPLERRFGTEWYARFRAACEERRAELQRRRGAT